MFVWRFLSFAIARKIFARVGIAAPAILSFVIIADLYPVREQQFFMAMLNGSQNIAVAVAPVLGSYLTLYFHWQGNFVALLGLGLLTLVMALWVMPKQEVPRGQEAFSWYGYVAVFRSKYLLLLMLSLVFICMPYWIFVGISSLLYVNDLGVSLAHFGYYQGVLAFVFAIGCVLFGLVIKRRNIATQRLFNWTNFIFILSFLMIAWVTIMDSHSPLLITLAMLIFVVGQIIPSVVLYPMCLNFMPQAKGRVSALIQGGRLVMTAVSVEVAGYFYRGTFQNVGILILFFILLSVVALVFVVKARGLFAEL